MQEETVVKRIVLDKDEVDACAKVAEIFRRAGALIDKQNDQMCDSDIHTTAEVCKVISYIMYGLYCSEEIRIP